MKFPKLTVRHDQHPFVVLGITILVVASIVVFYFHQRYEAMKQASADVSTYSLEKSVNAVFVGSPDTSADSPALNRLVRGKLAEIDENQQRIEVAAYVNFPDMQVTRPITLSITPRTQFLCWSKTYRTDNGITVDVEQAGYLLDDKTKLFQKGQSLVSSQRAIDILSKHKHANERTGKITHEISALIALEKPYALYSENRAFQIALLDCNEQ